MSDKKVWSFFYGAYMDFELLKTMGVVPEAYEVAQLHGFDITIQPHANLINDDRQSVYGIVAAVTHQDLKSLYAKHDNSFLDEIYLPEPVLVETSNGSWRPAFCYIVSKMKQAPAKKEYIAKIVQPAIKLGFPDWYVKKLKSYE